MYRMNPLKMICELTASLQCLDSWPPCIFGFLTYVFSLLALDSRLLTSVSSPYADRSN